MKYVIIHGTFGNPDENWFPRLKEELEGQGHKVRVPKLPTPENQTLSVWCDELQKQVPFVFDEETVLIGHSLGAAYILTILDRDRKEPIKKAVLVSGFTKALGNKTYDDLNATFLQNEYDRERIRKNTDGVVIFQGSDDPYVPFSEAENLHKHLGGELKIIKGGGHLNSTAGFDEFDELLGCVG